jgi:hypothetical protein
METRQELIKRGFDEASLAGDLRLARSEREAACYRLPTKAGARRQPFPRLSARPPTSIL